MYLHPRMGRGYKEPGAWLSRANAPNAQRDREPSFWAYRGRFRSLFDRDDVHDFGGAGGLSQNAGSIHCACICVESGSDHLFSQTTRCQQRVCRCLEHPRGLSAVEILRSRALRSQSPTFVRLSSHRMSTTDDTEASRSDTGICYRDHGYRLLQLKIRRLIVLLSRLRSPSACHIRVLGCAQDFSQGF